MEDDKGLPAAAASSQPCEDERDGVLLRLHNQLCGDLDRIKKRFVGNPKVSLVVRFEDPEKGIWLTDDTATSAIEYIRYMEAANGNPLSDVFRGGRAKQGTPDGVTPQADPK